MKGFGLFLILIALESILANAASLQNRLLDSESEEKLLFLHLLSCSNEANSLDFEEFANVSMIPSLAVPIYHAGLCGFTDFVQALKPQERRALTQVFSQPKSDWSFQTLKSFHQQVAQALGEGDNWLWFPRTAKFEWHGWTFYNWGDKMFQQHQVDVFHQGDLNSTSPICPCKLCIKEENSLCIEVSHNKAILLQA